MKLNDKIHIGELIKAMAKARHIKNPQMAQHLGVTPEYVWSLLRRESLETRYVVGFSQVLGFNFFTCYTSMGGYNKKMRNISKLNTIKSTPKKLR